MEGEDPDLNRRTVLRTTTIGLGALAVPGVAAANPGRGRGKGRGRSNGRGRRGPPEHAAAWSLEGGKLVPGEARGNQRAAQMAAKAAAPGPGDGETPSISVEEAQELMNGAVENGPFEIAGEEGGHVMLEVADQSGEF